MRLGEESSLRGRPLRRLRAGPLAICLARDGGRWYAFEDSCPHMRTPLSTGYLRDGILRCGMHNWRFDLESGRCVVEKWSWACLRMFPVWVEDGALWVEIPELRDVPPESVHSD